MPDNYQRLTNPPLVETSLCITVKACSLDEDSVLALRDSVAPGYEIMHEYVDNDFTFDINAPEKTIVVKKWKGAAFRSGNHVLTLLNETDGLLTLSFSMLNPYSSWDDFLSAARPKLDSILDKLQEVSIKRIGVRSIDRFQVLPYAKAMHDIFLTTPPDVEGLDTPEITDFLYKDTSFYHDFGLCATVIRSSLPFIEGQNQPSVILDSDVFTPANVPLDRASLDDVLARIRKLKNGIFFKTVGSKYLEMFK